MTPEEIAKQEKEALLLEIKGIVSDSTKGIAKQSDVDLKLKEINERIEKLPSAEIDSLKSKVDELAKKNDVLENASKIQGAEMTKLKSGQGEAAKKMTFREAVKAAILEKKDICLTEKNDDNGQRLSLKDYFLEKGNKTSPVFTARRRRRQLILQAHQQFFRH